MKKEKRDYCVCYTWVNSAGTQEGRTVVTAETPDGARAWIQAHYPHVTVTEVVE